MMPDTPATATSDTPAAPTPLNKPDFTEFNIVIYNQVGIVFSGEAKALACANNKGDFSILPGHTNFISMVTAPITLYFKDNTNKKFDVGLGVLRVLNNQIEVYTGLLIDKQTEALAATLRTPEKKKGILKLGSANAVPSVNPSAAASGSNPANTTAPTST